MATMRTNQPNAQRAPWQVLSGNALKYLMAALMVCDHVYEMFPGSPLWLKYLGRPVLPIFIFLVTEGWFYTRSRGKYMLRLLLGFEIMNVCSLLLERFLPVEGVVLANSAFGTMFIITLLLFFCSMIYNGCKNKKPLQALGGAVLLLGYLTFSGSVLFLGENTPAALYTVMMFVPNPLFVEGTTFILLGVLFYALRRWRWAQVLALAAFAALSLYSEWKSAEITGFGFQWMMIFAAVPMLLYNGKRGRGVNPKFDKWFFYIFYPAHIYALYFIAWLIQK